MLGKCQVARPSETGSTGEGQRAWGGSLNQSAPRRVKWKEVQRHRGRHARCPFWAGWQRNRQEEQP